MLGTRIMLYSVLGLLLGHLGHTYETVEFWCVVGLFWAIERISHIEVIDALNKELEQLRKKNKATENTND